jgi:hypothetical protein
MAALQKIESSGALLRDAVYRQVKSEAMLRHIKALGMAMHNDKPVNAQEREFYASQRYVDALSEEAEATAELAKLRSEIDAAKLTVEVWRTEESSARAALR